MIQPSWVAVACGVYVLILIILGLLGRRSMRRSTLSEFYLAGHSLGFLVLLLTLFATQYSGNSLSGFPGKTYRSGLSYIMSVTFMVGIISGYTLFAPRLVAWAKRGRYLTPTDFIADRFRSPWLCYLSSTIFAFTLLNFLLAQLMALGHTLSGLTEGAIPFWVGVLGGAGIILIYETLGGMRAVAWTDAVQGLLLLLGLLMVIALIVIEVGTPAQIIEELRVTAPETVANPGLTTCATWLSSLLLLGLGAPLYPQAIQRLYAARRVSELRRALAVMAIIPLFAITAVIFVGITGRALFTDLDRLASDQVTFRVLGYLVEQQPLAALPVLMVVLAVLAAIMSTADSALLSLSSIFTKDFVARVKGLDGDQADRLTRYAPWISLVLLALVTTLAIRPRFTLWRLLEIKFEILIQLSPAFILGTLHPTDHPRAFSSKDIFLGMGAGLLFALTFYAAGQTSIGGFHPGSVGVAVNYLVVVSSRQWRLSRLARSAGNH